MQKIKKGDTVQAIAGLAGQEKRRGKVVEIFRKEGKCLVEGMRMVKKHQKASSAGAPSGIVEKNMKMDLSNLALVDPKTSQPSRVKIVEENGKKLRRFVKSGELVDKPEA
ncbi:MAG: 50S ribosomal protein L24 [Bradymonadales bacterium]|nr:MAG: 50S ribosomal protein L24 [Bradymonadales bacterium]